MLRDQPRRSEEPSVPFVGRMSCAVVARSSAPACSMVYCMITLTSAVTGVSTNNEHYDQRVARSSKKPQVRSPRLSDPRGSFSLTGGRRAHIHAIDHTSDIVSYKIPPLTPRRRSPKGGTAQTPRHKSEGPRAVVGHDTVCCTRDSEPAKTRVFVTPCNRDVEVKVVVVVVVITNYSAM